jgi:hypothetical protein
MPKISRKASFIPAAKDKEVVQVQFSAMARFDVLIELKPDSIEKLRAAIGKEFSQGESWQKLLLHDAEFDFMFRDEDIEIISAQILKGYPFSHGHKGNRIEII